MAGLSIPEVFPPVGSSKLFHHFGNNMGFAKGIVMEHGNTGFFQVTALLQQPFGAYLFHFFIALAFQDFVAKIGRQP